MSATVTKEYEPGLKLDDKGHLLPLTDEEHKARVEDIRRMFAEWADQPDEDPPGIEIEVMRGIDENRPERPLFRGMY